MESLRAARSSHELAAIASSDQYGPVVLDIAGRLPRLPPDASVHPVLLAPTCLEEVVDGGTFVLDAVARRHGPEVAAALRSVAQAAYEQSLAMQAPRIDAFIAAAAYVRPALAGAAGGGGPGQASADYGLIAWDAALAPPPAPAQCPRWVTTLVNDMQLAAEEARAHPFAQLAEGGHSDDDDADDGAPVLSTVEAALRDAIHDAAIGLFRFDDQMGAWPEEAVAAHTAPRTLDGDGDPVDPALLAPRTAWRPPVLGIVDPPTAITRKVQRARANLRENAAARFAAVFGGSSNGNPDGGRSGHAARDSDDDEDLFAPKIGLGLSDTTPPSLRRPHAMLSGPAPTAAGAAADERPLTEEEREARAERLRALPSAPQLTPLAATTTLGRGAELFAPAKPPPKASAAAAASTDPLPQGANGDAADDIAFATDKDAIVFVGGRLQLKPKRQPKPKPAPKEKPPRATKRKGRSEAEGASDDDQHGAIEAGDGNVDGVLDPRESKRSTTEAAATNGASPEAPSALDAALAELPAAVRTAAMIGLLARDTS